MIEDERYAGEFRISTLAYYYGILADPSSEPLLAWHWDSASQWEPHIHAVVDDPRGRSRRLHIPTGGRRVSFEEILQFLIEEWAVVPANVQWRKQLGETRERFNRFRVQDRDPS